MQLINTQVGHPIDGMVTVEFQGEGGEVVAVKMAAAAVEGEAAIDRAKAIMVQLTSFGEDRDTSQDDREHPKISKGSSETDAVLPIVSSFGAPPSSAA